MISQSEASRIRNNFLQIALVKKLDVFIEDCKIERSLK